MSEDTSVLEEIKRDFEDQSGLAGVETEVREREGSTVLLLKVASPSDRLFRILERVRNRFASEDSDAGSTGSWAGFTIVPSAPLPSLSGALAVGSAVSATTAFAIAVSGMGRVATAPVSSRFTCGFASGAATGSSVFATSGFVSP